VKMPRQRWRDGPPSLNITCPKCQGSVRNTNASYWDIHSPLGQWIKEKIDSNRLVTTEKTGCFGCRGARYVALAKLMVLLYDLDVCELDEKHQ
jgi:hypothetical protein